MDVRSCRESAPLPFSAVIGGFARECLQMLPQSCGGNLMVLSVISWTGVSVTRIQQWFRGNHHFESEFALREFTSVAGLNFRQIVYGIRAALYFQRSLIGCRIHGVKNQQTLVLRLLLTFKILMHHRCDG